EDGGIGQGGGPDRAAVLDESTHDEEGDSQGGDPKGSLGGSLISAGSALPEVLEQELADPIEIYNQLHVSGPFLGSRERGGPSGIGWQAQVGLIRRFRGQTRVRGPVGFNRVPGSAEG